MRRRRLDPMWRPRALSAAPSLAPQAEPPARAPATRRADLDWLRVGGMLLVFTLHAAQPFNPWDTWHIVSPDRSKALGEVAFVLAPFIMPLLMILAGESAWHALDRRSPRRYVRERLLRIGLPLVLGILALVPPQVWAERRLRGQFQGSLLAFYPHFFEGVYPEGNFSWHHLWFLVFLLAFALVTLPVFVALRTPRGRDLVARAASPCTGAAGLAWLVLPAIAIRLAVGFVAPWFAASDWSGRALLLPAFVAGFLLGEEPRIQVAVDRHWRAALGMAIAASAALGAWAWPGYVLARIPDPRSPFGLVLFGAYAACAWCWLVALLGAARAHLSRPAARLARLSELVYPFYVLHHPIVVMLAAVLVALGWRLPLAFVALWSASLALTLVLCAAVGALGPVRVVFGLRRRA